MGSPLPLYQLWSEKNSRRKEVFPSRPFKKRFVVWSIKSVVHFFLSLKARRIPKVRSMNFFYLLHPFHGISSVILQVINTFWLNTKRGEKGIHEGRSNSMPPIWTSEPHWDVTFFQARSRISRGKETGKNGGENPSKSDEIQLTWSTPTQKPKTVAYRVNEKNFKVFSFWSKVFGPKSDERRHDYQGRLACLFRQGPLERIKLHKRVQCPFVKIPSMWWQSSFFLLLGWGCWNLDYRLNFRPFLSCQLSAGKNRGYGICIQLAEKVAKHELSLDW